MTQGAEADGARSSAARTRAAWISGSIVGLVFLLLLGGLLGYQSSERRRRIALPECHLDTAGKSDSEVYAVALRCLAAGMERMPLSGTTKQDVELALHLLIEALQQAARDHRAAGPRPVEL